MGHKIQINLERVICVPCGGVLTRVVGESHVCHLVGTPQATTTHELISIRRREARAPTCRFLFLPNFPYTSTQHVNKSSWFTRYGSWDHGRWIARTYTIGYFLQTQSEFCNAILGQSKEKLWYPLGHGILLAHVRRMVKIRFIHPFAPYTWFSISGLNDNVIYKCIAKAIFKVSIYYSDTRYLYIYILIIYLKWLLIYNKAEYYTFG